MKIYITGIVATGKSTLARTLSNRTNMPCFDFDSIVHDDENKGIKRTKEEQDEIIKELIKGDSWIIEGSYSNIAYNILTSADVIVYLKVSHFKRNMRILNRFIKQKIGVEKRKYSPSFKTVKTMFKLSDKFEKDDLKYQKLLKEFSKKTVVLSNAKEIVKFIETM